MPDKQKWKIARAKPDEGGPCGHCPPLDADAAKKRLALVEQLAKTLTGKDLASALESVARITGTPGQPCHVCAGSGLVKVCDACDGHGVTEKTEIEDTVHEPYEVEEEVEVEHPVFAPGTKILVREARREKRKVTKTRVVKRKAWLDGAKCTKCNGCGQVSGA